MHYDFTSIHVFLCVAEEKSLTRASRRAHLAVSAISKRIAELENRVGAPLFTRLARGMELTPAGQSMLAYARRVFETLQQMDEELGEYSEGIKGQISLIATTSALTQFLPHEIETFSAQYPGIKFDIEERVGGAIIREVSEGRADVGVFAGTTPAQGLEVFDYRSDELAVAVAESAELAERDSLRFSELVYHEFVGSHVESSLYALLTAEAEKLDSTLKLKIRVSSFDCMCRFVAGRQGIAILPRYIIENYAGFLPLKVVTLDEHWAKRDLLIGVRDFRSLTPTAKAFVEHLRNA